MSIDIDNFHDNYGDRHHRESPYYIESPYYLDRALEARDAKVRAMEENLTRRDSPGLSQRSLAGLQREFEELDVAVMNIDEAITDYDVRGLRRAAIQSGMSPAAVRYMDRALRRRKGESFAVEYRRFESTGLRLLPVRES